MSYLVGNTRFQTIAAGTVYTMTNAAAAVDFGTTDPAITITTPGTYMITGSATVSYAGSTFAASRTVTLKFRRTNNTPADLTGGTVTFATAIVTTVTNTAGIISLPTTFYSTSAVDDAITIFADVSTLPTAGTITVSAAQLQAVRVA